MNPIAGEHPYTTMAGTTEDQPSQARAHCGYLMPSETNFRVYQVWYRDSRRKCDTPASCVAVAVVTKEAAHGPCARAQSSDHRIGLHTTGAEVGPCAPEAAPSLYPVPAPPPPPKPAGDR